MFKKIYVALFISCISATSYAYVVGANLTVENKTDVPMVIVIDQPNGQAKDILQLPPHKSNQIYMQNGDNSGMLYQTSTAPFTIRETDANGKVYAQGRIAYYVGASMWNKYSFIDAVTAADNLKIDASYSCKNGGYNTTFENKIVIDGTPGNEMQARNFPSKASCQGFKASGIRENNQYYTAVCVDGTSSIFWKGIYQQCSVHGNFCYDVTGYYNGNKLYIISYTDDTIALQNELDRIIGNSLCGKWQV